MATATATNAPKTTAQNQNANPWDMTVGGGGDGGEYVLCPTGNYRSTFVGIFDVGHQPEKAQDGTDRETRKLVLVFELAKKRPDGKPFIMGEKYTWSMNEKANFYKLVTNITGVKFKEGDSFNPLSLLGGNVMVNVTNTEGGKKQYHNVGNVSQYPEDFPKHTPENTPVSWSVMTGTPFPAGLDWLPYIYGQPIKALAENSAEFKARGSRVGVTSSTDGDEPPF